MSTNLVQDKSINIIGPKIQLSWLQEQANNTIRFNVKKRNRVCSSI